MPATAAFQVTHTHLLICVLESASVSELVLQTNIQLWRHPSCFCACLLISLVGNLLDAVVGEAANDVVQVTVCNLAHLTQPPEPVGALLLVNVLLAGLSHHHLATSSHLEALCCGLRSKWSTVRPFSVMLYVTSHK